MTEESPYDYDPIYATDFSSDDLRLFIFHDILLGKFVVGISAFGFLLNLYATIFVYKERTLRNSTGAISILLTSVAALYLLHYAVYFGPLMILQRAYSLSNNFFFFLSSVEYYLFYVCQFMAFCLSLNRGIAIFLPVFFYKYASLRSTTTFCFLFWMLAVIPIVYMKWICPVYYSAVIGMTATPGSRCPYIIAKTIDFWMVALLSVTSVILDSLSGIKIYVSKKTGGRHKPIEIGFLYQSLFTSTVSCIEVYFSGFFEISANFPLYLSSDIYFVSTIGSRIIGRTLIGMTAIVFHKSLRTRLSLKKFIKKKVTFSNTFVLPYND